MLALRLELTKSPTISWTWIKIIKSYGLISLATPSPPPITLRRMDVKNGVNREAE